MCVARVCFGPSPSPGLDTPVKRQLRKQRVFGELCPGNFVPCPVGESGYEVSFGRNVEADYTLTPRYSVEMSKPISNPAVDASPKVANLPV